MPTLLGYCGDLNTWWRWQFPRPGEGVGQANLPGLPLNAFEKSKAFRERHDPQSQPL
jgi:hypothetical protein